MLVYEKNIDDDLTLFVLKQRSGEYSTSVFSTVLGKLGTNREYFKTEEEALEWADIAIDSGLWKKNAPYKVK